MAVNNTKLNSAYGLGNPLQGLAPQPIVAKRAPTTADKAELSTLWIDSSNNTYYVLTSFSDGDANWAAQATSGSTVAALEITGGSGTVLTVDAGGNTSLGGDLAVSGNSVLSGDLTVNGDFVANGDFDIVSSSALSWVSTANADPSILLEVNGGTTETLQIKTLQGTALDSVEILSTSGGVLIHANGLANTAAINLAAPAGGVKIDSALTSSINVVGAGSDVVIQSTGGSVAITGTESTSGAVTLTASGAAGTVALAGTGGISVVATNNAISLQPGTGAVNISTAAAANTTTIGNATGASAVNVNTGTGGCAITAANGAVTVASGTGAVNISADAAATTVNVATGGAVKALTLGSTNSTSATTLQSGSGALNVTATNGALTIKSGTGSLAIANDATIQTVGIATGAAAKTVTIGNTSASTAVTINTPTGSPVILTQGASVQGAYILAGAGAPTGVTAPQGSLYLNTTGNSSSTRLYVNSDSGTTWVAVTTAS